VVADIHLLVVEKHAIDGLDGGVSGFRGLVMNEAIAFGAPMLVRSDFARKHVAESCERVMKSLHKHNKYMNYSFLRKSTNFVIDLFIKILDEDISLASLAKGRVTLRPHDPAERHN
jgi:hypothetical protein